MIFVKMVLHRCHQLDHEELVGIPSTQIRTWHIADALKQLLNEQCILLVRKKLQRKKSQHEQWLQDILFKE